MHDTNRPASRPIHLLAVEDDGTVTAAWTVGAPSPAAAVIQLGEMATTSDPYPPANPARWLVHDRHTSPGGFWAAVLDGQVPPADAVAAATSDHPHRAGDDDRRGLAVPPRDLPLAERARWVARYILTAQAAITAHPGLTFHGTPGIPPGTGDIAIETGIPGGFLAPLGNAGYLKSPDGFGWGYGGSGSAATAVSLLAAALGRRAACPACRGAGELDGGAEPCAPCDGLGIGILPAVHQRFKEDVVAGLPKDGEWYLPRVAVLFWLERQDISPRLAALARDVPR